MCVWYTNRSLERERARQRKLLAEQRELARIIEADTTARKEREVAALEAAAVQEAEEVATTATIRGKVMSFFSATVPRHISTLKPEDRVAV
jgi:hypothetical protein